MAEIWQIINELLITVVTALVGLIVWYARTYLQQKLNEDQLRSVQWIAAQAVQAAESYGGDAEQKKRSAVIQAEQWLHMRGIQIDLDALDGAIEAAVYAEINKGKPITGAAIEPAE